MKVTAPVGSLPPNPLPQAGEGAIESLREFHGNHKSDNIVRKKISVQPLSILIIEDEPGDFGLIQAYLRMAELGKGGVTKRMAWAKTLAEGIAAAIADKPDIVLLDLSLPDSAGLSTVQSLRAAVPGLPIVVLTGHNDNALAASALQAGAQDYLIKGQFDHYALGHAVRHALVRDALEARLRLFEVALNSVANGIVITDTQAQIQWVNPAFTELTGFTLEEALGYMPGDLLKSGKQGITFYQHMWETILSGQTWRGEVINRRKDGILYDEALTIAPVIGANKAIQHFVAIMQDITERKQSEEQISKLAFYDTLTSLPNRRLLNDRLEHAMAASRRSERYGAVIFLDMDNFKPLNDSYGHSVGDLLLKEVACRLSACVREVDTVARFGGDEFVVLLSELDANRAESAAQAAVIAEKIRAALARPYSLTFKPEGEAQRSVAHRCPASIGVALFLDHEASAEDLLKWSDMAMYSAKEGGRNQIRFHEPEQP